VGMWACDSVCCDKQPQCAASQVEGMCCAALRCASVSPNVLLCNDVVLFHEKTIHFPQSCETGFAAACLRRPLRVVGGMVLCRGLLSLFLRPQCLAAAMAASAFRKPPETVTSPERCLPGLCV
jgi:hypothetical protein